MACSSRPASRRTASARSSGTLGVLPLLRVLPVLPTIAGAWALTGACWIVMGRLPSLQVIAVAGFVSGLAVVVGNAGVTAQITRGADGPERRTLMAGQSVVVNAAASLGLLAGGPVLAGLGAPPHPDDHGAAHGGGVGRGAGGAR